MTRRMACLACALAACGLMAGCRVTPPSKGETVFMQWVKRNVTVGGTKDRNPLGHSPDVLDQGKSAFGDYCTVCHGLDGQNTGVPFADAMSPPVPSLKSTHVQSYSDGQIHWVITNGIFPSGMPAAQGILTDDEIWDIVIYIRNLPPEGSLGEPQMYKAD